MPLVIIIIPHSVKIEQRGGGRAHSNSQKGYCILVHFREGKFLSIPSTNIREVMKRSYHYELLYENLSSESFFNKLLLHFRNENRLQAIGIMENVLGLVK